MSTPQSGLIPWALKLKSLGETTTHLGVDLAQTDARPQHEQK